MDRGPGASCECRNSAVVDPAVQQGVKGTLNLWDNLQITLVSLSGRSRQNHLSSTEKSECHS